MIDSFSPSNVWAPFGAFSMGVIQGDGQVLYLKGQVSLDRDGKIVGQGDMRAQTRQVVENIQTVLRAVGGEMSDVMSLTQYTTDIARFMTCGDIRKEYFAPPYPITTTVEVARLYDPNLMLEITAVAEVPRARFKRPAQA